jgi:hypothetical protein
MLTFGEFWHPLISLNVPKIPVGFPYLDLMTGLMAADRHAAGDRDRTIVFISSGETSREVAASVCSRLAEILPSHHIIIKLRRDEWDWAQTYPADLQTRANVTFVSGSTPSLYDLFGSASYQIGVNSTALYEGLHFGLRTFVVRARGAEELAPLIANGVATLVGSAEEVRAHIARSPGRRPVAGIDQIFRDRCSEHFPLAVAQILAHSIDRLHTDDASYSHAQ